MTTAHAFMTRSDLRDIIQSILAHLFHGSVSKRPNLGFRLLTPIVVKPSHPSSTAFRKVSLAHIGDADQLDYHALYWWRASGHSLAVLLEKAGYSSSSQCQLLEIIWSITPFLGAEHVPGRQAQWKSFMTDDHTPIELSWDWRTGNEPPKIRFSIEPVGVDSGTHSDPHNHEAASKFRETVLQSLSPASMAWLDHFRTKLTCQNTAGIDQVEGHRSTEFYAFDLNGDGSIMTKAYFFPGYKAKAMRCSNLEIITNTITQGPDCTAEKLQALRIFRDYVQDASSPPLEMDMLAIDLVEPANSRFKVYFRVRDTSFASVKETMTLGSRIRGSVSDQTWVELRRLYHSVLGRHTGVNAPPADSKQLPPSCHRTAGILYNVEFSYDSKSPKVKVYLPVRHYARSEEAVMSAIGAHFQTTEPSGSWRTSLGRYREAIDTILCAPPPPHPLNHLILFTPQYLSLTTSSVLTRQ